MINRMKISALTLSACGLVGIASYEGFSDSAYIPVPGDVPTIGFGHADNRIPMSAKISVSDALGLLERDTRQAQAAVKRCITAPLNQNEFDAFTSLAFNIGPSAFCNSTLVKKANAQDYAGACNELKRWVYFKGKKLAGLEKRREQEFKVCTGEK